MNKQPTVIRTYLLRGVFSLSLAFVIAIPMARGQSRNLAGKQNMNTSERTPQVAPPGARRLPILPMPQAPQVVLYDQYNNGGPNATRSTSLTDLPTFSTDLADDFVVPAGQTWNVQSIDADGTYNFGSGPATDWNVFIYTDNAAFLARLLIFAVGTIAGMMLITAIIAVPITYLSNRFRLFHRYVASAAGVLSFVFGLFLVHHIWFLDRLFR